MLSESCLDAYSALYPDSFIGYEEPGDLVIIDIGIKSFIQPIDETDESFMERLNRCTPDENVFLKEWPENKTDYNDVWL